MDITIYEPTLPRFMDDFIENFNRRNCKYYASEIFQDQLFSKEIAINYAINRAKYTCSTLNIPLTEHFVSVYRSIEDEVYVDWKLSSFAAFLTLVNGDPADPLVAGFQNDLFHDKIKVH